MNLREVLAAVVRSWKIVLVCCVLGITLGAGASLLQPTVYEASASGFLTARLGDDPDLAALADDMVVRHSAAYLTVATSKPVLERVIEDLDLDTTPAALARSLDVSASGSVLSVKYVADDAGEAQEVAAAVVSTLGTEITDIEASFSGGPVAKLHPVTSAREPTQVSPTTPLNLVLGTMLGLFLGLTAALMLALLRPERE